MELFQTLVGGPGGVWGVCLGLWGASLASKRSSVVKLGVFPSPIFVLGPVLDRSALDKIEKHPKRRGKLQVPAWIWSSFGGVRLEKSGFEVHLGRMVWQASLPASALAGSTRRGGLLCPTTKCQRAGCSAIASDYDASFSALMLPHSSRL